jgi:phosphatidylglycerol lysyltransferase
MLLRPDARNTFVFGLALALACVLHLAGHAGSSVVCAFVMPRISRSPRGPLEPFPFLSVRVIVGMALAAMGWARNGRRHRHETRDVERLLQAHGASSVAWFALDRDTDYFWGPDRDSVIAYREEPEARLVIGDPIGPRAALRPLLEAFAEHCRSQDRAFALFQARPELLPVYSSLGWHALHIGEDPVLPTATRTNERASIAVVRRAARGAEASGLRVIHAMPDVANTGGEELPSELGHELRSVSCEWARSRNGGGRGFCVGRFDPPRMRHEWIAMAWDPDHRRIEAFASWVPIPARRGWALDLVRTRSDARAGALELLVVSSLAHARHRGDAMLSLSLTPVAFVPHPHQPADGARTALQQHLMRLYHFPHDGQWKRRFDPSFEDRYLVVPEPQSLPRIVQALVHAQTHEREQEA